ncbi:MAG: ACP S-malonyltransferase [Deltaproteobacteria bacterium]|jgi:[acyl-carrier-protein] S-malonyltransferase|nr:ACP S-malonyltransferase [Deltaproteobacteria bacterium]
MKKNRLAIICPGRGSYTKETLGYLTKYRPRINDFIEDLDSRRKSRGEPTISELDQATTFSPGIHTKGENASTLIYACSYADFQSIDLEKNEIVAVTGNSMGWYLALAFGGALNWAGAFDVINTMGSMMKDKIIGGQIIYPVVNGDWIKSKELLATVEKAIHEARTQGGEIYSSIHLGGYAVLGGDAKGLSLMMKLLPKIENYPFQLVNHAAFHTPLLKQTSERASEILSPELFQTPTKPLVDGRGKIWQPYATDLEDLYRYTLDTQVVDTYDFTKAVTVTLKEFAPDKLVLLGPGNSLGGSIGQILVENKWQGIQNKVDFSARQKEDPFLISMGL